MPDPIGVIFTSLMFAMVAGLALEWRDYRATRVRVKRKELKR